MGQGDPTPLLAKGGPLTWELIGLWGMESELGVVQIPFELFISEGNLHSMNSKQMGDEQVELRSFRGCPDSFLLGVVCWRGLGFWDSAQNNLWEMFGGNVFFAVSQGRRMEKLLVPGRLVGFVLHIWGAWCFMFLWSASSLAFIPCSKSFIP